MSAINKLKGLLLNELRGTNPEVRKSMLRVLNSIDSDLDIGGYVPSSEVDDSFENLFKTLSEVDYDHDEPSIDIGIELPKFDRAKPVPTLRQIDRSDREEEVE